MSDQGKSNFQAFGAGLLGFVAVMAIGGGALMVHNSQRAKASAAPVAAAAPIDLGSSAPRPLMTSPTAQKEGRAESPAPLMGADEESEASAEASSAGASAAAPSAAAAGAPQTAAKDKNAAPSLEPTQHQDMSGHRSTAEAIVKNTLEPKKERKTLAKKTSAAEATAIAPTSLASVHYGVTSRNELMGRAAGPVYNVKGGAKGASVAGQGKIATGDAGASIADLQAQLEKAGLPQEQRALILGQLEAAKKTVSDANKPAQ